MPGTTTIKPGDLIREWRPGRGYTVVVSPLGGRRRKGVIVFVHGGSFTAGSPRGKEYSQFIRDLAQGSGMTVIAPDYPVAPGAKSAEIIDCVERVVRYAKRGYGDVVLAGDSAGACVAMSVALSAPRLIERVVLLSPWIDLSCSSASWHTRAWCPSKKTGDPLYPQGTKVEQAKYRKVARSYLGPGVKLRDPLASPYWATDAMLSRLPPSLFLVGGSELIRSDTVDTGRRLQDLGRDCTVMLFDGMWHDWPLDHRGRTRLPQAVTAKTAIATFCAAGRLERPESAVACFVVPKRCEPRSMCKTRRSGKKVARRTLKRNRNK